MINNAVLVYPSNNLLYFSKANAINSTMYSTYAYKWLDNTAEIQTIKAKGKYCYIVGTVQETIQKIDLENNSMLYEISVPVISTYYLNAFDLDDDYLYFPASDKKVYKYNLSDLSLAGTSNALPFPITCISATDENYLYALGGYIGGMTICKIAKSDYSLVDYETTDTSSQKQAVTYHNGAVYTGTVTSVTDEYAKVYRIDASDMTITHTKTGLGTSADGLKAVYKIFADPHDNEILVTCWANGGGNLYRLHPDDVTTISSGGLSTSTNIYGGCSFGEYIYVYSNGYYYRLDRGITQVLENKANATVPRDFCVVPHVALSGEASTGITLTWATWEEL